MILTDSYGVGVFTSSDLAALGHLLLKEKAFAVPHLSS